MNEKQRIVVDKVTKIYGTNGDRVEALHDVSIAVEPGEFMALAGPSGSGKSTLLNLLGGLDRPSAGKIYIGDTDITFLSPSELCTLRLRQIGFIFQSYNLIPILTVAENVEYVMLLQGIDARMRRAKAMEILKEVGLGGMADRWPVKLSGGQQQRVAVARAIVSRPALILADEPTANLDSKTAANLLDIMAALNEKHKVTFIFSSHDPLVLSRAKRIIYLHDGEVVDKPVVQ